MAGESTSSEKSGGTLANQTTKKSHDVMTKDRKTAGSGAKQSASRTGGTGGPKWK